MPSANKSSRVSPVTAEDVFEEFKKKLNLLLMEVNQKLGLSLQL